MWFDGEVLPINLANVIVKQTARTMMIAMNLVWMMITESMTSCKTSWLWLPLIHLQFWLPDNLCKNVLQSDVLVSGRCGNSVVVDEGVF